MKPALICFDRNSVFSELRNYKYPIGKDLMLTALLRVGHYERLQLFNDIIESDLKVTDKAFAEGLRFAYTTGKMYDIEDWFLVGTYFESVELSRMLKGREKKLFDTLPQVIEIYRGCCFVDDIENLMGYSWTLKKEIADFFAYRFNQSSRAVYKKTINKNEIAALFLDRKEFEVIVLDSTTDVELVSHN